jgi:vanillate O-demethylase monooxygenase subunit
MSLRDQTLPPFVHNTWYVAGWADELKSGERLGRTFLGQPVALFRTASGQVGALEDRCVHRAMPLSAGVVDGEALRCLYHGLEFGTHGRCTHIPAQDKIPATAKVRSFPLVERDAMLWIWMGDAERADENAIPDYAFHRDPVWAWRSAHFHVKGNWQLLIDNLMDLSHLPYIHPHTIGVIRNCISKPGLWRPGSPMGCALSDTCPLLCRLRPMLPQKASRGLLTAGRRSSLSRF